MQRRRWGNPPHLGGHPPGPLPPCSCLPPRVPAHSTWMFIPRVCDLLFIPMVCNPRHLRNRIFSHLNPCKGISFPPHSFPGHSAATAGRGDDAWQAVEEKCCYLELLVHHRSHVDVHFIDGGFLNSGLQDQAAIFDGNNLTQHYTWQSAWLTGVNAYMLQCAVSRAIWKSEP